MEFFCDLSGNKHKNIFITKKGTQYVCWHDLNNNDKNWHQQLDKALIALKKLDRDKYTKRQDLYIFDDIHMDDNFIPKSDI